LAFFTQAVRIPLTSGEIREAEVRTEGWLAGWQLLALSMQGHTDPRMLLTEVHGTHHYILDYLTDEVLRQQPAALQAFLLRTSILERLCAPLCDRVMEQSGSQLVLEHLEHANLFVVALDERRQWYRYHALFAETLRYRLQQTEGEAVAALHLRASQWYAQQGNLHEAVRHATSAGDWQRVADLIEPAQAVIWSSHEHAMLRRWLEQLPVEVVRSRPRLCLAYARILYQVAPYNTMERWLQDAETALRARFPAATSVGAETGALPLTEQWEWDDIWGEIASFRAAVTAFTLGEGHSALALQGVQLSEQTEMIVALYFAYSVLMRVYQAQGEMDAARLAFQKSEATLAQNYSPYRRNIFLIAEWVQFWLAGGEVDRASLWAQELVQQPREPSPLAREREDVARARILLAQEKPTEALSLLEPLQSGAQRQGRWNQLIEMRVLQALALSMGDQEQEALAVLAQALQLAEPEGYIRIFVDEGAPMASLLSRLREQEDRQVPTGYVDTLLASFGEVGGVHDDATGTGPL
jgi:LuxR family transcriptional regulator, maltose regulon positive regulatory protein